MKGGRDHGRHKNKSGKKYDVGGLRRMFATRFLCIMLGICLVMTILIPVMTTMAPMISL